MRLNREIKNPHVPPLVALVLTIISTRMCAFPWPAKTPHLAGALMWVLWIYSLWLWIYVIRRGPREWMFPATLASLYILLVIAFMVVFLIEEIRE